MRQIAESDREGDTTLNRSAHMIGGAVSPWVLVAAHIYSHSTLPSLLSGQDLLVMGAFMTGMGALGGILPDSVEPPRSPRHRGFFHYVLGGLAFIFYSLVLLGSLKILSFDAAVYFSDFITFLVLALVSGCASHFFLDVFFRA